MADSRIDPPALVNTVIAAGLVLLLSPIPFGWWTTIGGVTLLLILFAYDGRKNRSILQSLAFSAVCGLAFTLAAGFAVLHLTDRAGLETALPLLWLCATVIGTTVDRARMDGPTENAAIAEPAMRNTAPAAGLGLGSGYAPIAGRNPFSTAASFQAQPSEPSIQPVHADAHGSQSYGSVAPPILSHAEQETAFEEREPLSTSAAEPPPVGSIPLAPLPVTPTPGLEVATIYVDVIGQGISYLRSVQAEHIARDIYRIVDVMPPDETWRYQPGQAVRCKKKKLSGGKALVAFEEIVLQQVS